MWGVKLGMSSAKLKESQLVLKKGDLMVVQWVEELEILWLDKRMALVLVTQRALKRG